MDPFDDFPSNQPSFEDDSLLDRTTSRDIDDLLRTELLNTDIPGLFDPDRSNEVVEDLLKICDGQDRQTQDQINSDPSSNPTRKYRTNSKSSNSDQSDSSSSNNQSNCNSLSPNSSSGVESNSYDSNSPGSGGDSPGGWMGAPPSVPPKVPFTGQNSVDGPTTMCQYQNSQHFPLQQNVPLQRHVQHQQIEAVDNSQFTQFQINPKLNKIKKFTTPAIIQPKKSEPTLPPLNIHDIDPNQPLQVNSHSELQRLIDRKLVVVKSDATTGSKYHELNVDELRKQQRLLKNRQSASESRRRQRDYIKLLEEKVVNLEKENLQLKERLHWGLGGFWPRNLLEEFFCIYFFEKKKIFEKFSILFTPERLFPRHTNLE